MTLMGLTRLVVFNSSRSWMHSFASTSIATSTTSALSFIRLAKTATPKRCITTRAARALLGFPTQAFTSEQPITLKALRQAYFAAAKKCHPDMKPAVANNNDDGDSDDANTDSSSSSSDDESNDEFLQLTKAYELLQALITKDGDLLVSTITSDEEEEFRAACRSELGVPAEIVEECKRTPIFRQWLAGNTDSAHRWKIFFLANGGLAPKLRPSGGALPPGNNTNSVPAYTRRRKRK